MTWKHVHQLLSKSRNPSKSLIRMVKAEICHEGKAHLTTVLVAPKFQEYHWWSSFFWANILVLCLLVDCAHSWILQVLHNLWVSVTKKSGRLGPDAHFPHKEDSNLRPGKEKTKHTYYIENRRRKPMQSSQNLQTRWREHRNKKRPLFTVSIKSFPVGPHSGLQFFSFHPQFPVVLKVCRTGNQTSKLVADFLGCPFLCLLLFGRFFEFLGFDLLGFWLFGDLGIFKFWGLVCEFLTY